MTEEMSLCGSTHWDIASWMVDTVGEDRLLAPFNARCVDKKDEQDVHFKLVQEIYEEFRRDERLQDILSVASRDPQIQQSLMREALKHLVEKAYSKYSSTYPEEWFALYRREVCSDADQQSALERELVA